MGDGTSDNQDTHAGRKPRTAPPAISPRALGRSPNERSDPRPLVSSERSCRLVNGTARSRGHSRWHVASRGGPVLEECGSRAWSGLDEPTATHTELATPDLCYAYPENLIVSSSVRLSRSIVIRMRVCHLIRGCLLTTTRTGYRHEFFCRAPPARTVWDVYGRPEGARSRSRRLGKSENARPAAHRRTPHRPQRR